MTVFSNGVPVLVTSNATATPSATATFPTGSSPAAGDLMVAVVTMYGAGASAVAFGATPGGWQRQNSVTASTTNISGYYLKVATGSDSAPTFTGTITGSTAADDSFGVVLFDLGDSSGNTPVFATDGTNTGTSGTITATTSHDVPSGGCLGIGFTICSQGTTAATTTWTTPTGWQQQTAATASARSQPASYVTNGAPASVHTLAVTFTHSRTSTEQTAIVAVFTPPLVPGLTQPVSSRATWLRAGNVQTSLIPPAAAPPVVTPAPVYPLTQPVRARITPSPRGHVHSRTGAPPVHSGPVFRQATTPARAPVARPFSKGRASGSRGAAAVHAGPAVRPLTGPVQARRPLPPRGRALATSPPVTRMQCGAAPLYVYPSTVGPWQAFLTSTGPLPQVVILNSGSGDVPWNSDFETLTVSLHALGITVLGYVYTQYGARPAATVEAAVGNYLGAGITPGGNGVDGIFLDEFASASGSLSYYQGICASIQSQFAAGGGSSNPPVWGNPGTYLDSSYLALPVEAFVTFEGDVLTYQNITPYNVSVSGVPQTGASTWSRTRFAHLVYSVTRTEADGVIDRAWANYAGWAYVTNWRGDTNPYGQIPGNDYLADEVTRAAAEPVYPAAGIPPWLYPLQQPARARLPEFAPRAGRAYGNPGTAPVHAGPRLRPLTAPVAARLPLARHGRAYASTTVAAKAVPPPIPAVARPLTSPVRARQPLIVPGRAATMALLPVPANPTAGPALRPLTQAVRARQPLPPRGRVTAARVTPAPVIVPGTVPPLRQAVRITPALPRRGRAYGNPGAPVRNPAHTGAPLYPLTQPVRARLPLHAPGHAATMGVLPVPVAPPPVVAAREGLTQPAGVRVVLARTGHVQASVQASPVSNPGLGIPAPPLTQAVRARQPLPPHGRVYGSRGAPVRNPAPLILVTPLTSPVRAKLPRPLLPGRAATMGVLPVPLNPSAGPPFSLPDQPAQARRPLPPRGRAYGNPGAPVSNPAPPPVVTVRPLGTIRARLPVPLLPGRAATMGVLPVPVSPAPPAAPFPPLTSPARPRILPPPRGRAAGSQGAPVSNPVTGQGPPVYPLRQPARSRITPPPRGRDYGHPGAPPVHSGPVFRQATAPVRAPVPQPFSKGRASGSRGAPVNNPVVRIPVLNKALRAQPPVFLKGRAYGNAGAPVRNPTQGPQFRQATSPARYRIVLPPRGRVYGNIGAPIVNPVEGPVPPGTLYLTPGTIIQGQPYAATTISTPGGVLTISNAEGAVTVITPAAEGFAPSPVTPPPDSDIPPPDSVVVPAYVQR